MRDECCSCSSPQIREFPERQHRQQSVRLACHLHFPNNPARVIHNADAGFLDRYIQSSKMVHAALLLLMLEAVTTDLVSTISLKRSTQNLQLSTSCRPITPSSGHEQTSCSQSDFADMADSTL